MNMDTSTMMTLCNFIDGKYVPPISGKYLDNYNPASGTVYSLVPDSDEVRTMLLHPLRPLLLFIFSPCLHILSYLFIC